MSVAVSEAVLISLTELARDCNLAQNRATEFAAPCVSVMDRLRDRHGQLSIARD